MRPSIRRFVQICAETLPVKEPIYEFGSFQVAGQEDIADLRTLFPGKRYVGSDMREGPGVDVILDLHSLDLPDDSVGTALMIDTMEHVEYPHKAIDEVNRVLAPGGILIMTSVMRFPIHDHPYDYWRFTPEAFSSLLKPFAFSFADHAGEPEFPHTVVGIGADHEIDEAAWTEFRRRFAEWKQWARVNTWPEWLTQHPKGVPHSLPRPLKERVKSALPPSFVGFLRKLKGAER